MRIEGTERPQWLIRQDWQDNQSGGGKGEGIPDLIFA
jgi:hypothetical protein